MRKSIEIFIIFILAFFITSNVFAGEMDVAADSLEYVENCGRINAKGNVVLNWEDKKVYADYVELASDKKIMNACGNVKVEENGSTVYADSVSYNYDDETGDIKETFTRSSTVFMRAKSMKRQGKDTFEMKNVKLSTCDCDDPHTCFRSKYGKLVLNKRVTIYNAVLYAGKIPIFYLPVVTKSLEPDKGFGLNLELKVEPGYTWSGGLSLKNIVLFSFGKTVDGDIKYDYLGRRGEGYGGKIGLSTNKINASVYGYWNDDLIAKKKKWILIPVCFYRLNDLWTIRAFGDFQDANGLHDNFSADGLRPLSLNSKIKHSRCNGSVVMQGSRANLTIFSEHVSNNDKRYGHETESEELPCIRWNLWPRKTFMDIYHHPRFEFRNHYAQHSRENYFYRRTVKLGYVLTKNYILRKGLTLNPTLVVTENWYDWDKNHKNKEKFFTQYYGASNLRFRATNWMYWNVNYAYQRRTKPNCLLNIDYPADDYGIESNDVTLRNIMYLGENITVENKIKYNMLRSRSKPNPQYLPLTTELTWIPKDFITVIAKESQLMRPFKLGSFLLDLKVGELKKAFVNFITIYQNYDDDTGKTYKNDEIKNVFGFGVWLTPKWRLDYNIRTTLPVNFSGMRLNDHEIRLYRDSHCWHLGIAWKIINSAKPDQDISFKFGLKTNMPFSGKSQNNFGYYDPSYDDPSIFYPWEDKDPTGTL
ncbi:MAG: hypothetical protein LE178_02835 [Endomicrobium sp.]|nr:hypothetical protein [Endomicrobium sp.]